MFPFQQGSELSFQISNHLENTSNYSNSNSSRNNNDNKDNISNIIYNDTSTRVGKNACVALPRANLLHLGVAEHGRQTPNNGARRGRPRRLPAASSMELNNHGKNSDVAQKRTMHREIERQRRQEMANHFSTLRSLLPLEYIRGKRSTCDHLSEAARYIKDLENNINELQQTKEQLIVGLSSSSGNNLRGEVGCSPAATCSSVKDCNVSIQTFSGGFDVEITIHEVGEEHNVFPLSRVLQVLDEQGLDVIDCASSRVNQRWIYIIRCEVTDERSIDSSQLQQKLMSVVGYLDDP